MYPARIAKERVRTIPRKLDKLNFVKYCFVKRRASGSQRSVFPIFPYSIQTTMQEEKAKEIPPIKDGKPFKPIPFLRNRYINNPARKG